MMERSFVTEHTIGDFCISMDVMKTDGCNLDSDF